MVSVRINPNTFYRHDTVLVKYEQSAPRGSMSHIMARRRVVHVLLPFKCHQGGKEQHLALVSWFKTIRIAKDTSCGMYLVRRIAKRSVISVKDIERPLHLMLKFGGMDSTDSVTKAMEEARQRDCVWRNIKQL
jgi:hypothetical protein